ncbi:MAG: phosphoglucosamine mutase [Endomicrobium sp.]|nr:phosphoglucosamine mutase [Endomicrobium sp.]
MRRLFGTDGIRGDSSKFPFDNKTLNAIGMAIAEVLGSNKNILIVRDTRESGKRIQKELAKGMSKMRIKPVFSGIMPTPAAASLIVKNATYSAAIVISASHNPYMDNGIKIFNSKGFKLAESIEKKIEHKVKKYLDLKVITDNKLLIKEDLSFIKSYANFLIKNFKGKSLKGKTIVIDCANGASYKVAPYVLKKLGAKVIALNIKPNGKNINSKCGALYPEFVAKYVKKYSAFCGFAFDGDSDRLMCVDENGIIRDGDFFLAAMARWLKKNNKLKNNVLVSTVMANLGLIRAMRDEKINIILSKVGDRYVVENMKKYKSCLGGEQSGHFIFKDVSTTGDGILSSIMLLCALCQSNKTMSEFMEGLEKFPQVLINSKIVKKVPIEQLPKSYKLIKVYEKSLGQDGRILVRYSGTENLLRVMVEGKNTEEIKKIAESLISSICKEVSC